MFFQVIAAVIGARRRRRGKRAQAGNQVAEVGCVGDKTGQR